MPEVLGLDIGGANIKAATTSGQAYTLPFPLWKQSDKLSGALHEILVRLPHRGLVALTMTGELCDCFPTKSAGVRHILLAVQDVFREQPVFVWRNDGKWASINHSLEDPLPIASANWLASATYAARYLPDGPGCFLDLGSTTFDIIHLSDGKVVTNSRTDLDRLRQGELAYVGCSRTPICNLLQEYDLQGQTVTLAAEWFATLDDARLVLNQAAEDESDRNTADGQPRTQRHAATRLARMLCSDVDELGREKVEHLARATLSAFRGKLLHCLQVSLRRHEQQQTLGIILAGSGEGFLAEVAPQLLFDFSPVISLTGKIGPDLSTALAAYAVATLLAERQSR
jgi:(4-(4-[2-(gamma-L-glutamylamino)ethyl]phenoxymethyl)furan-2-yl)methanamine synthase